MNFPDVNVFARLCLRVSRHFDLGKSSPRCVITSFFFVEQRDGAPPKFREQPRSPFFEKAEVARLLGSVDELDVLFPSKA